ncbi:MAG: hypothetical protein ACE5GX_17340 [Thermoanaerobaculia bacterium]
MARRSIVFALLAALLATAVVADIDKQDTKTQKKQLKQAKRLARKAGLWIKVPKPKKNKPDRLGLLKKPRDVQFAACPLAIDPDERIDKKTLTFEARRGVKALEINSVTIEATLPADWSISGPAPGHRLTKRQRVEVEVTFQPQETRISFATLKLEVESRPDGNKSRLRTVEIPLIGDGTCPLAADGTGVHIGPVTDPKVKIGAALDNQLQPLKNDIEVCVVVYYVKSKDWDKMTDKQKKDSTAGRQKGIDAALAEANAIFEANNAGIKFNRKGDLQIVNKLPKGKDRDKDKKCLEIYFDPNMKKGDGTSHAKNGVNVNNLDKIPKGLDKDYTDKLHMGESIDVSSQGHAGEVGKTLAHELGHALGLGAGPDSEDHREPDDYDKKVADDPNAAKRMMKHENPGKEMRRIEVELAREIAKHMNATRPKCEKQAKIEDGSSYIAPDSRGDLQYALILARPETIEWRGIVSEPIDAGQTIDLALELDTDRDTKADQTVACTYRDAIWACESTLPGVPVVQHLWEPWVNPNVPEAWAFSLELDRESLPVASGDIGWRLAMASPSLGTEDAVPLEGLAVFDITPPSLDITVEAGFGPLRLRRGRFLDLSGGIELGPTFSGQVAIRVRLESAESSEQAVELDGGVLIEPIGSSWETQVRVPRELKPGAYVVTVEAACDVCRVSDSETLEAILE